MQASTFEDKSYINLYIRKKSPFVKCVPCQISILFAGQIAFYTIWAIIYHKEIQDISDMDSTIAVTVTSLTIAYMIVLLYFALWEKNCYNMIMFIFFTLLASFTNLYVSIGSDQFWLILLLQMILSAGFIAQGYIHYTTWVMHYIMAMIGFELLLGH